MFSEVVNEFRVLFNALMSIGDFPELRNMALYILGLLAFCFILTALENRNL